MTSYFLDASVLVKRYSPEPGSAWTVALTDPSPERSILVAEVSLAEVAAALGAKQRAPRGISLRERDEVLSRFLEDCDGLFLVIQVSRAAIDVAVSLTQRHRLRGYDAVQLATALVASRALVADGHEPLVFVASDSDLVTAAQAQHLATENPLDHARMDATV